VRSTSLSAREIRRLLRMLDAELAADRVLGELHLVGGAVMCLALRARHATKDVDAIFRPTAAVRRAAHRVARRAGLSDRWLNDAVKGFLGPRHEFGPFLELPNLRVFVASPRYLLAMKLAAMRLGPEFHDLDDVRFLLRLLDIRTTAEAVAVARSYFDADAIPAKTRYVLEDLLDA
jgi:hypothetical protein